MGHKYKLCVKPRNVVDVLNKYFSSPFTKVKDMAEGSASKEQGCFGYDSIRNEDIWLGMQKCGQISRT